MCKIAVQIVFFDGGMGRGLIWQLWPRKKPDTGGLDHPNLWTCTINIQHFDEGSILSKVSQAVESLCSVEICPISLAMQWHWRLAATLWFQFSNKLIFGFRKKYSLRINAFWFISAPAMFDMLIITYAFWKFTSLPPQRDFKLVCLQNRS